MPLASLSDARIYYEISGNGPPLVLVPGLGSTAQAWEGLLECFDRSFTTIRLDHRGVGRSEALRPAKNISDYSVDLVELLDHLQLDSVHVLGQSLGGIIAQRFAAEHPGRIDKLVLISSTHRFAPYLREIVALLGVTLQNGKGPHLYHRTLELLGSGPAYFDADPTRLERAARKARDTLVPRRQVLHQIQCLLADDGKGESIAARITCPTLVVAGQYDAIIPPYYAQQTAQRIAHSRFLLVPNSGHDPLADCPDQLIPAIGQFLYTGEPGLLKDVQSNAA